MACRRRCPTTRCPELGGPAATRRDRATISSRCTCSASSPSPARCAKDARFRVWSLGEPGDPEAELIRRFFDGIDRYTPQLVSWNGGGFDLPVLNHRALIHGVAAARFWDWGDDDRDFKFNNYLGRYHTRHLDLMDVLAMYQPRANAGLDAMARLCGFPGKLGMDGSEVHAAFRGGKIDEIRSYCETDVMNTYLLYLRFQHAARCALGEANTRRKCRSRARRSRRTRRRTGASSWRRGTPTASRGRRARSAKRLGAQDRQRREAAAERSARRHAPPAVEHGRVDAAKIDGVARIAVAGEPIERRLLAVHPAAHAATEREVHAGGAVIGAVGQILLRPAPELGVGQHERVVPLAELVERALAARRRRPASRPAAAPASRAAAVRVEAVRASRAPRRRRRDWRRPDTPSLIALPNAACGKLGPEGVVAH